MKIGNPHGLNWRNPQFSQSDNHPVVRVNWNDAKAYIKWLGKLTGKPYRLPSESEREYATKAGSQTAFWWGDTISSKQANYNGTSDSYNGSAKGERLNSTVPVNSYYPNPFGLFNVHGNVYEWVHDIFHDSYNGAPIDGSAWTTGFLNDNRVIRSGSWASGPAYLRSAMRGRFRSDCTTDCLGFRLALTL